MNFYIDIRLKPDAEMRRNVLMNMVYTKLHKALFDIQCSDVGVSFPEYKVLLGNLIRIHSNKKRLRQLLEMDWVGGLGGYCLVSEILAVPKDCSFRRLKRKRQKLTKSKLKRLQGRGSLDSPEDVKGYKAKMFKDGLSEPYVELASSSNGNSHRRYFEFGELLDQPVGGEFDSFGLSKTGTVPWF